MNIGQKIRELRKARGITQEQLAESIGISFQAISKWETGISMPDITLAPVIAAYFAVSMDVLFDFNIRKMEQEIDAIVKDSARYRESDPPRSRAILEEGLKKYPGNDVLLNCMLYVMNYSEDPDATIRIASRLIDTATITEVRYDALRFLAYAYKVKGDIESAKAALEQIPEFYFTKLTELAFLLDGEEKYEAAEKQKWVSYENMLQMMGKVAEYYEESGEAEKAVEELEKALKLLEIMDHPSFDIYVKHFTKKIQPLN